MVTAPDAAGPPGETAGGSIFPRSLEPEDQLTVVSPLPDEWTDRLFLASLQGLVNKGKPKLYLGEDPQLGVLRKRGYTTENISWQEAIERFISRAGGAVVYDPDQSAVVNAAVTQAGIEGAVPVTAEQAARYGLEVIATLGDQFDSGQACLEWAVETLWPHCSRDAICILRFGAYELEGQWRVDPIRAELMADYLVRNRIFTFFLPPEENATVLALARKLLGDMKPPRPVMGMFGTQNTYGEWETVVMVSEAGHFFVPTHTPNFTVQSGVPVDPAELRAPQPPPVAYDPDKVYLTFNVSDGDNMAFTVGGGERTLRNQYLMSERWWLDPRRGECPIGWSIGPLAVELAPAVLAHFFKTATDNDSFLCATSGVGYCYPKLLGAQREDRATVQQDYMKLTADYMTRLGLRTVHLNTSDDDSQRLAAEMIPGLSVMLLDYGRQFGGLGDDVTYDQLNRVVGGVPVCHAYTSSTAADEHLKAAQQILATWDKPGDPPFDFLFPRSLRMEVAKWLAEDIIARLPRTRPAFIHGFINNWLCDTWMIAEIARRLPPEVVVLPPDTFGEMARKGLTG